jgi:hypothetical protein
MSLVKREDMATLRPASEAKATAATAEDDLQIQSIAYLINEAANTGLCRVIYQQHLRENVKKTLESNGYTIKYVNNNSYDLQHHALILWGNITAGDLIDEPSLNGGNRKNNLGSDEEVAEETVEEVAEEVVEEGTKETSQESADAE